MPRSLGGAAAVICAIAITSLLPLRAQADPIIERIQRLAESSDPAERRSLCAEILELDPRSYARHFCEGYEAIYLGLDAEAEQSLTQTLSKQSDFSLAAVLYGEAYEGLGNFAQAERYYRWAIEAAPRKTDGRYALGMLYLRMAESGQTENYPKALEAFRQMAEVSPSSPDGFSNMGYVLTRMGRYEDAESLFERAISKAPRDPVLLDNLASLYERWGKPEDAERVWKRALSLNPTYGSAVVELSALYGRTGRLVDAMMVLEAARGTIVAPPWGPKIHRNLGYAFLGGGDLERAQATFLEAASVGSADALTHLGLGHLRMIGNVPQIALDSYQRAVELDSTVAVPFVRAWRNELRAALDPASSTPLSRMLDRIDRGSPPDTVLHGATGRAATEALVGYVLEGWNFEGADLAIQEFVEKNALVASQGYDTPPKPITQVPAAYPERAQERGLEGEVLVKVSIDETGKVTDAQVERSTADRDLVESALSAAMKWTFEPAVRYGSPVSSSIVIPFSFKGKR